MRYDVYIVENNRPTLIRTKLKLSRAIACGKELRETFSKAGNPIQVRIREHSTPLPRR